MVPGYHSVFPSLGKLKLHDTHLSDSDVLHLCHAIHRKLPRLSQLVLTQPKHSLGHVVNKNVFY